MSNFFREFAENLSIKLIENIPVMIADLNRRCAPYVKGSNTQSKPINIAIEHYVRHYAPEVLRDMGIDSRPCTANNVSDCSLEWDKGILQLDAKGCHQKEQEFCENENRFKMHCGVAQTSLKSDKLYKGKEQVGVQKSEIDGKPVHTFISGIRWGFNGAYYIESVSVANIPHDYENVSFNVGKSTHEMRIILKNQDFWMYHRIC